jgi:uncharacterized membrane protein YhaH (DUF805 family)
MLDFLFSFRGRIGRLRYFLGSMALSMPLVLMIVGIIGVVVSAGGGKLPLIPLLVMALFAVVSIPVFLYSSLSMQARRIRDIGWNPLYVIPAWIGVGVIDRLIAQAFPALSIGHLHFQTLPGLLLNLAFGLVLLFWPGGGDVDSASSRGADRPRPTTLAATPGPAYPARGATTAQRPAGARTSFGLRGT